MTDSTKIFICPFNPYHKLQEYRKWQFHTARCGDRRGKTVYSCQYHAAHYYCDLTKLIEHEAECEHKQTQKTRFDNTDPEVARNRIPNQVYCKYDVDHVFGSIADCQEHQETCPKRSEHERKADQCRRKYQQNMNWIKAAQAEKKKREEEVGGNINAPASSQMPNLRYQYVMNEPFVGGIKDSVQSSLEANVHKRRVAYDLDIEEEKREQTMTVDDHKERMKEDLCKKINEDLERTGAQLSTEDVNTLLIKQDTKTDFGLKIDARKHQKLTLFEFNSEQAISLEKFTSFTGLDLKDQKSLHQFIDNNFLLKLHVFEREEWKEKALEVLDDHQMKNNLGNSNEAKVIFFNQTQGRHLNQCIENSIETHNVLLFLISKETHSFGKLLKNEFKCDFILLKFELPYAQIKDSIDCKFDGEVLNIAKSREVRLETTHSTDRVSDLQCNQLKDENAGLVQDLNELREELKAVSLELETANKSIIDKERQIRGDKKDILYFENQVRNNKTKLTECLEQLGKKEEQLMHSEKETENLRNVQKKNELQFEKQVQRTEAFQNKMNELQMKLDKATLMLNNSNKIIQTKTHEVEQLKFELKKKDQILQQSGLIKQSPEVIEPIVMAKNFVFQAKKEETTKNETEFKEVKNVIQESKPEDFVEIDSETEEEGEIMDEEETPDLVNTKKAQFKLKQLDQSNKDFIPNPESVPGSERAANLESKIKASNASVDVLGIQDKEELRNMLLCVSCEAKPRCMMIQTCKHVPFCVDCDKNWKIKCADQHKQPECPMCRKEYKKTTMIQL